MYKKPERAQYTKSTRGNEQEFGWHISRIRMSGRPTRLRWLEKHCGEGGLSASQSSTWASAGKPQKSGQDSYLYYVYILSFGFF